VLAFMAEVEAVFEVGEPGGEPLGLHAVAYPTEALVLLFHCCNSGMAVGFKLCLSLMVVVVVFNHSKGTGIECIGCCSQGMVPSALALEELLEPVGHGVKIMA